MRLALVKAEHMKDWYLIERAEHDGREWIEEVKAATLDSGSWSRCMRSARVSDADVEGTAEEMRRIAVAIDGRAWVGFKRCAVQVFDSERVEFWSPRNSQSPGVCTLAEADELSAQIKRELATGATEGNQP